MDSIPAQLNQTDYYLQAEKDRSHMLLLGRIFFFLWKTNQNVLFMNIHSVCFIEEWIEFNNQLC